MKVTAALILGCCALLFVSASALPPRLYWPWAEDVDAETESYGCCTPKIVPTASLIRPVHGIYGDVAINVDWGTCTPSDHEFMYV